MSGRILFPSAPSIRKGIFRPGPNRLSGSDEVGDITTRGITINLSAATIADTASIGATVGAFSVSGGTGSYTYTLTSNPGTLFAISGSNLNVAASLSAGSDPITVKADNGAGSVVTRSFLITVTHAGSGYVPTFELLGF